MNKSLLLKYISGQTCKAESDFVEEWVNESERNKKYLAQMMNLWIFQNMPDEQASDQEVSDIWREIKKKESNKGYSIPKKTFWAVAASLFILLTLGLGFLFRNNNSFVTPRYVSKNQQPNKYLYTEKGVKAKLTLPDSSIVWLNSDSKLYYPDEFKNDIREITLCGEAYFEVKHEPERPMIVNTNKGFKLEVLGTTFNLKSYDNDNQAQTTLYSGSINIIVDDVSGGQPTITKMQPNDVITIYENRTSKNIHLPDPTVCSAWKDGKIIFDNLPMDEAIKIMERWHGIEFEVKDPKILKQKITANFDSESIVRVMDLIRMTSFIDYKIDGKKVYLRKR